MKQVIKLTEGDLHKIIRNVINEALNDNDNMVAFESSHIRLNSKTFTVVANFYDYTYCFKQEIVETFDNFNDAKDFALTKIKDRTFMQNLAEDAYSEMDEEDETSIDDINFEIFDGKTSLDSQYAQPIFVTKGYASLLR